MSDVVAVTVGTFELIAEATALAEKSLVGVGVGVGVVDGVAELTLSLGLEVDAFSELVAEQPASVIASTTAVTLIPSFNM